ncbi:MAG: YihY/virulence factor BrkB family protein, partial [Anaerolineae bacterium]|nr:YihY/virulence factor BrkB family protein [Anaerolineae bacterium]
KTLGPDAADLIRNLIDNLSQPREGIISTLLGVGALLFGALGVFNNMQASLDIIWDVEPEKRDGGIMGFIKDKLVAFGMLLVVGFLLIVSLVISTMIPIVSAYFLNPLPGTETLVQIINILISFGVITLLFALIYRYLPHVEIEWRDVWVGAAVTSVLFSIGQIILSIYLSNSTLLSPYGAAGAFVVILLWIYYSAQIVLFGAEFTQVYARRYGSNIVPSFKTNDETGTGHSTATA